MKGPGLFWMLQIAAGVPMAGPMFVVGIGFLRSGNYVGGLGFLALGAIALYFPTYLINRIGGPRTWLRRRFGSTERDSADTSNDDARYGADADSNRVPLLDRLRER
ncbi:hypothetical protein [Halosolutus halophilus]|uniref:hypothetical protein n=1 Tax=Halosolutus halophilus TaxID=1552990 RepID=UPI002235260C|nr:hypothetical protein [Halosolutus halophilus]